jgi:hypothetical protein
MARLAVKQVWCTDPQERLGDEIYVLIDGNRHFLQDSFEANDAWQWSDNDHEQFSNVVSRDVGTSARVELWERDTVGDDHIASRTVDFWPGGEGARLTFASADGSAAYDLTFDWV